MLASPFNVGTEFDEELHRFQMSIIARIVNRRLADIIPASNIGLRIHSLAKRIIHFVYFYRILIILNKKLIYLSLLINY